ncbi:MAG: T9SS type A sorting domain-containing protein, partial [Bacteroidales bacterium]
ILYSFAGSHMSEPYGSLISDGTFLYGMTEEAGANLYGVVFKQCLPVTVSITASTNPICAGNSTTLTASGGSTYSWSGGLGTSNPVTVSPTTATTYTVTATNTAGCTGTGGVTVTVNPVPTVGVSASANPICNGTSTTLTASGATTYSWSGGLGTANPLTVSPTTTTTYTVTGTSSGCTNTANITVTVNSPAIGISASANPICAGTSTTLTASGGTTYSWSGGLGSANPLTVSPTTVTTYTVTGTTSGCTGTANVTINVNSNPTISISASANPVCTGTTGNIYSTQSGMTGYTWTIPSGGTITAGAGTDSITVTWNVAGTDTVGVNYTDANGCTSTTAAIYNVTVNSLPQTPVITIHGDTLISSVTIGNQWYNTNNSITGANDSIYVPLITGDYFDIVVDSSGCKSDTSNKIYIVITGVNALFDNNCCFEIYPNPANDNITIENSSLSKNQIISVYDIQGNLLIQQPVLLTKITIDVSVFAEGIYVVKVKTEKGVAVKKFVKE